LPEDERKKKELVEVEIEQLSFFDTEEDKSIFALSDSVVERNEGPKAEELN